MNIIKLGRLIILLQILSTTQFAFCQTDSMPVFNRENVLQFLDSIVPPNMEKYHIPGTAISIVKDGEILFSKGYGYRDLEKKLLVEADKTLFRVASLSKLFTATAVLQLQEKGLITMNSPIEPHLGRVILKTKKFEEPITFHHLLTHTSGFENSDIGDAAKQVKKIIPLEEFVNQKMVHQIFPPGRFYFYSNHGFTLAGYLVSSIAKMPYEDYMRAQIFEPLNMAQSSFEQPLPNHLVKNLAVGYDWDGSPVPLNLDYSNVAPADGLMTTASDMAQFMLAHLQKGRIDSSRTLLQRKTWELMFQQQYAASLSKYGQAYGFQENFIRGRKVFEHTGGQYGFVSLLQLFPEEELGIFITQNNRNGAQAFRGIVSRALMSRFFTANRSEFDTLIPPSDFGNRKKDYVGTYRDVQYPHTTFEKVAIQLGMMGVETYVKESTDGLTIFGNPFVEIEPNLFQVQSKNSNWKIGFKSDQKGKVSHMTMGRSTYERVPWHEQEIYRIPFTILALFVLVFNLFFVPIHSFRRKRLGRAAYQTFEKRVLNIAFLTGLSYIAFILLFFGLFATYKDQLLDYGVPVGVNIALAIASIGGILSLISPFLIAVSWAKVKFRPAMRIYLSFFTLVMFIFSLYLSEANLIGF